MKLWKKVLTFLLAIAIVCPVLGVSAAYGDNPEMTANAVLACKAAFEGEGTEDSPYLVDDYAKFVSILDEYGSSGASLSYVHGYFLLTKDMDMVPYVGLFHGVLDGGGHTLRIVPSDKTEFIRLLNRNKGTVKNLRIEGDGKTAHAGLIGSNGGLIENVTVVNPLITRDSVYHTVGKTWGVTVYTCEARKGILVDSNGGIIRRCKVMGGSINVPTSSVGAIAGHNWEIITMCVNQGTAVSGTWNVGGIVGMNSSENGRKDPRSVTKCMTIDAEITASGKACGGIVGSNGNSDSWGEDLLIEDCMVVLTQKENMLRAKRDIGGIAGYNNGRIHNVMVKSAPNNGKAYGVFVGWQANKTKNYLSVENAVGLADGPAFGSNYVKKNIGFYIANSKHTVSEKSFGPVESSAFKVGNNNDVVLKWTIDPKLKITTAPDSIPDFVYDASREGWVSTYPGSILGDGNLLILIGAVVVLAGSGGAFMIIKKKKKRAKKATAAVSSEENDE